MLQFYASRLLRPSFVVFLGLAVAVSVPQAVGVDAADARARRHDHNSADLAGRISAPSFLGTSGFDDRSSIAGRPAAFTGVGQKQNMLIDVWHRWTSPVGRSTNTPLTANAQWIQRVVGLIAVIMSVSVFMLALANLVYRKYYPPDDHILAFLTADDDAAPAVPETDSDDVQKQSSTNSSSSSLQRSKAFLPSGHVTVSTDDIINDIGVSGMTVLPPDNISGVTKMRYRYATVLIVFQACLLQVGMLHFLATQLVPRGELHGRFHELPMSIVFIAIYLHFLNCTQEFPYSWQIFRHLQDFHEDVSDLILMGGVLALDAFVVPLLSFVLGALYLCTSRTISDVILNAVAVAFVHEIDNWILAFNQRANFVSGKVSSSILHLPTNKETMRKISWSVIFVPVVPVAASAGMLFFGWQVLKL